MLISIIGITRLAVLLALMTTVYQAAAKDSIGCWTQQSPSLPEPIPTIFKYCQDTIRHQIMLDSKVAMVPQLFSRTPGKGFTVPFQWQSGNCIIAVDTHTAADEDTLRFYDIAVQASMVNVYCVARPPHWGGTSPVGPMQVVNVSIVGAPLSHSLILEIEEGALNASKAED